MTPRPADRSRASSDDADGVAHVRARALSSPLRLRVLRLCAFDSRTNKELAELLAVNPGTMLHHVRTLVNAGFLAAEADRTGAQGSREVPYRATGLSWRTPMAAGGGEVLVNTFLQQIAGLTDDELSISWLGLKLNDEHRAELGDRLFALLQEFKQREPDADGIPYSLFTALHVDLNPPSPRSADPGDSVGEP